MLSSAHFVRSRCDRRERVAVEVRVDHHAAEHLLGVVPSDREDHHVEGDGEEEIAEPRPREDLRITAPRGERIGHALD